MARHKPAHKMKKVRVQINGPLADAAEDFAAKRRSQKLYEFVESLLLRELLSSGIDPYATGQSSAGSTEQKRPT